MRVGAEGWDGNVEEEIQKGDINPVQIVITFIHFLARPRFEEPPMIFSSFQSLS